MLEGKDYVINWSGDYIVNMSRHTPCCLACFFRAALLPFPGARPASCSGVHRRRAPPPPLPACLHQNALAAGGQIAHDADRVVSNPEGQRRSRLNMSRWAAERAPPAWMRALRRGLASAAVYTQLQHELRVCGVGKPGCLGTEAGSLPAKAHAALSRSWRSAVQNSVQVSAASAEARRWPSLTNATNDSRVGRCWFFGGRDGGSLRCMQLPPPHLPGDAQLLQQRPTRRQLQPVWAAVAAGAARVQRV